MKSCNACPFNDGLNEEASQLQNYGCLPSKQDMVDIFDKTGVALSCHDNTKPCRGLASVRNIDVNKVLDYSNWYRIGVK